MPLPMDQLLKIARSATPDSGVQFRAQAYGETGMREFLRDALALAWQQKLARARQGHHRWGLFSARKI